MDLLKTAAASAIDWLSVKLGLVCSPLLFTGVPLLQVLGGLAAASTIIYNSINIYLKIKEIKRTK